MDASGNFVVVWSASYYQGPILARRFDSAGTALGGEFQVSTAASYGEPALAIDASGHFVVVWQGGFPAREIFGRRFDSTGTALGSEFQVNTTTGSPRDPSVATDASGNFAVVWTGTYYGPILGQRFDSSGTALASEFQASATTGRDPAIAMDAAGIFTVVWDGGTYYTPAILGRQFDSSGTALGSEIQVSTTIESVGKPALAMDDSGNFTVVWESGGYYYGGPILGQRLDSLGTALGAEFPVSTAEGAEPAIAMDALGNFTVVWDGGGYYGGPMRGRSFDREGIAQGGSEFQLTTAGGGDPAIAMDTVGNFVTVWKVEGYYSAGILGQRFSAPPFFLSPPASQTVREGANVSLGVTATRMGTFTYPWRKDGENLVGSRADVVLQDPALVMLQSSGHPIRQTVSDAG
jgi:hypothetical protein